MNATMEARAATLTDPEASTALIRACLPGFREGHWIIERLQVMHCRRRISRRLLAEGGRWLSVVWRLEVRDRELGRRGHQWLHCEAFLHGLAAQAWEAVAGQACGRPAFATPIEHLAAHDLLIWALPNDPALAPLPAFLDPAALAVHLPDAARPDPGTRPSVATLRLEPAEHCLARVETLHRGGLVHAFGKCYAGEQWRDARDAMDALWKDAIADHAAFAVAEPLGSSPTINTVWQRELVGTPLALELEGAQADAAIDRLARALLRLQQSAPLGSRRQCAADFVALAGKWRNKLSLAEPRLAPSADKVLARIELQPRGDGDMVSAHGDFHLEQMIWTGGRIGLFDYDNFTTASRHRDLADFISQLLCRPDGLRWMPAANLLLDHYRRLAGDAFEPAVFEWYLRMLLLRKAYSFFVRSHAGWQARAAHALALALTGLDSLCAAPGRVAA